MMNDKKIKQNIVYSLGLLAVLALAIPAKANADQIRAYDSTRSQWLTADMGQNTNQNYYYGDMYNNTAPTNSGASTTTPVIYSNENITPNQTAKTNVQAKAPAKNSSGATTPALANKSNTSQITDQPASGYAALTANAVFGSVGGLYPSGLVQWLIFAILIITMVILIRKIFGYDKDYDSTPMKHS